MELPGKTGPPGPRPAEDLPKPDPTAIPAKPGSRAPAPLSSKMLAIVIVVGLLAPLAFLGWVAFEKSRDRNTVGDAFGALLFLIVIAAIMWNRIKFGLRVRSMTSAQIRAEIRPRGSETRRQLHLVRRSPLALAGLVIVGIMVSLSVLAPVLYSVGAIKHWDPKEVENPTAQNYFQLLPPSTQALQQYDLYATRAYQTGPMRGEHSGFGAYVLGKANLSATGDFFLSTTTQVVVNVSDSKAVLDRVEISAAELKVQAGGALRLEARAFDAQGRRLAANFDWTNEGPGAGIHPSHGSEVDLYTSTQAAGSEIKVTATARLWSDQTKSVSTAVSVVGQMPAWSLDHVIVWPDVTVGEVTDFIGNNTIWKPKTVEARAFAVNGTRIPSPLLQVGWEVLPGNHNASMLPDPNLPAHKANVTNTRRATIGVPVDVRATVTLGTATVSNTSRIHFANRLDIDRVEVTPPRLDIIRGEFVELHARAFDEIPQASGRFFETVDALFTWNAAWDGGGRPGATDWSSAGPALSERLEIDNPGAGGFVAQIENTGDQGPFYLDGTIVTEVWDARNLTNVETTETVVFCRQVEKTPCETFKAANMLGGGDPMGRNELRSFGFSTDSGVKSLRIRLYGPDPAVFGRDTLGRDYLSVLVWGSQISLRISFIVVASAVLIGVVLGGLAGYLGGKVDELVMRVTDVFLAIPGLILAMGVAAVLTRSLDNIMYALVIVSWPGYTRLIRAQALSVRESLFVEAARAVGVPEGRIIMRHVIPNCLSPVLVAATLDIGGIVLTAAALSFIGFGALPPTPEWGLLINEGTALVGTAWWLVTLPGLMIFTYVLGFNLFGDGLRDILDPKLRQ